MRSDSAVPFRHTAVLPSIAHMGFVGVDLFFVLSGFLISGLLYQEYHKRGAISFPQFFIRRGLKIYPAFYVIWPRCALSCALRPFTSLPRSPTTVRPSRPPRA
jgi:peptidoglycan/LPS O-acetylase OafA/YrhL